MGLLYWAGLAIGNVAFLITLPPTLRSLPDCRRRWQLRWSRSSAVRLDLISSLRTGLPASTPAMARDVLEYVASMRRGLVMLRTPAYLTAGGLFAGAGLLWVANGVRLSSPTLVALASFLVTCPFWTWWYAVWLSRRLDRAELGNADLAQRPDLYLVRSVELDCISN
jgi:hypothetical protein